MYGLNVPHNRYTSKVKEMLFPQPFMLNLIKNNIYSLFNHLKLNIHLLCWLIPHLLLCKGVLSVRPYTKFTRLFEYCHIGCGYSLIRLTKYINS